MQVKGINRGKIMLLLGVYSVIGQELLMEDQAKAKEILKANRNYITLL